MNHRNAGCLWGLTGCAAGHAAVEDIAMLGRRCHDVHGEALPLRSTRIHKKLPGLVLATQVPRSVHLEKLSQGSPDPRVRSRSLSFRGPRPPPASPANCSSLCKLINCLRGVVGVQYPSPGTLLSQETLQLIGNEIQNMNPSLTCPQVVSARVNRGKILVVD